MFSLLIGQYVLLLFCTVRWAWLWTFYIFHIAYVKKNSKQSDRHIFLVALFTHINTKMFCDSAAVFSQHTKRQALLQEDPYFVLVLQLHLGVTPAHKWALDQTELETVLKTLKTEAKMVMTCDSAQYNKQWGTSKIYMWYSKPDCQ